MNRYYCPYCSINYQSLKKGRQLDILCKNCGDKLIKVPLVKGTQLFAIIIVLALISPLFIMLFSVLDNNKKQNSRYREGNTLLNSKAEYIGFRNVFTNKTFLKLAQIN